MLQLLWILLRFALNSSKMPLRALSIQLLHHIWQLQQTKKLKWLTLLVEWNTNSLQPLYKRLLLPNKVKIHLNGKII